MRTRLRLEMQSQPDDTSCGPTCLHAVYQYFDDKISLDQVIKEVPMLEGGGTLAVHLACHALRRGYEAKIYTYNLHVFDPTWFNLSRNEFANRLRKQMLHKLVPKLHLATKAYLEFIKRGGQLCFEDLSTSLLRRYLKSSTPILTGLSSTFLYASPRETADNIFDDIEGEPAGHFVVVLGYDKKKQNVLVADPLLPNPFAKTNQYEVGIDRLVCSILLGILTYDANFLVITPKKGRTKTKPVKKPKTLKRK